MLAIIFGLYPDACICQDSPSHDEPGAGIHGTHQPHMNHIAVFGGVTVNLEKKGSSPTIGVDYTRRLTDGKPILGVGFFGEAILAAHTEWLVGALFYYKPFPALWFRAGPGVEFITGEAEGGSHNDEHLSHSTEFVFRIGAGYAFNVGVFTLVPGIDLDIVREHTALVAGLNVGYGF
ncbi:MAG: hypothetical protein WBG80_13675 [Bacteroidota bacterium]